MPYDAIVLAGGGSRRLGRDKTALRRSGRSVLDWVLDAVATAERIVVVGEPRPVDREVTWVREEPAGGGPTAAVVAGLGQVVRPSVVVLAGDLPNVTAGTVSRLLEAASGHDGAILVDGSGREQHLTVVVATGLVRRATSRAWPGRAMRELLDGLDLATVPAQGAEANDLDTPADVTRWSREPAGVVQELWRYPVKSLAGEAVQSLPLDERGASHDREWALYDDDGKFGAGKSSRRFRAMPGLMKLSARMVDDLPTITFPNGTEVSGDKADEALSAYVDRPVRLGTESLVSHFDESPVHLVTTGALRWLEERHGSPVDLLRLRPNVVVRLDGDLAGDDWVGRPLWIGDVQLRATHHPVRCVMVGQEQVSLGTDRQLLHTLEQVHDLTFGVHADVLQSGSISVGDTVYVGEDA